MKIGKVEKFANVGTAARRGEEERIDKMRGLGMVSLSWKDWERLVFHTRDSKWQGKAAERERHNENGVWHCPSLPGLVEQVEGCCGILRVTEAGPSLYAGQKWNRKSRNFLVPTGNGMVRDGLAQTTHFISYYFYFVILN